MRRRGFALRIVRGQVHEHADAPHTLARLLCAGRERPPRRPAEQRDDSRRFIR
jgi:hypothetical protein